MGVLRLLAPLPPAADAGVQRAAREQGLLSAIRVHPQASVAQAHWALLLAEVPASGRGKALPGATYAPAPALASVPGGRKHTT